MVIGRCWIDFQTLDTLIEYMPARKSSDSRRGNGGRGGILYFLFLPDRTDWESVATVVVDPADTVGTEVHVPRAARIVRTERRRPEASVEARIAKIRADPATGSGKYINFFITGRSFSLLCKLVIFSGCPTKEGRIFGKVGRKSLICIKSREKIIAVH